VLRLDIILFTTYPLLYVSMPLKVFEGFVTNLHKNSETKNSNWLIFCILSYSTLNCTCIVSWTITTVLHVQYMAFFVLQNLERPPEYEVKSCYLCICAHKTFRSCYICNHFVFTLQMQYWYLYCDIHPCNIRMKNFKLKSKFFFSFCLGIKKSVHHEGQ